MTGEDKTPPNLELLLTLEGAVWEALTEGDAEVDRAALDEAFLGVYPSGFSGREGHMGQLADGPTVAEHVIEEARMQLYSPDLAMLAYLARYRRPGKEAWEAMYVSSLWQRQGEQWRNLFSQDTPVAT